METQVTSSFDIKDVDLTKSFDQVEDKQAYINIMYKLSQYAKEQADNAVKEMKYNAQSSI